MKNFYRICLLFVCVSSFFISLGVFAEEEMDFSNSTRSTIDSVVTWGIGISGAANLALCTRKKSITSNPISFYTFNSAAVTYWAMDQFISDKDKDASEEIASRTYGGTNDEQMNSYLRSRDLARANEKAAEKKGHYKLAASVVMLASAAYAMKEESDYEALTKKAEADATAKCSSAGTGTGTGDGGVAAAQGFTKSRCENIGRDKVACTDSDIAKIEKVKANCIQVAGALVKPPTTTVTCPEVLKKGGAALTKAEKAGGKIEFKDGDFSKMAEESAKDAELAGRTGVSGFIDNAKNPVVNVLTMFSYQYAPGSRAILYGVLGAIVGVNAYANNSAAIEFGEEADYFQGLVDGMESCGDDCHSSGAGGDDSATVDGGGTMDDGTPTGGNSVTYNLSWNDHHSRSFSWLDRTGSAFGGPIKLVFSDGCGELTVSDPSNNRNDNTSAARFFCGTQNKPEESNGTKASIFSPVGCNASSVTVYYD